MVNDLDTVKSLCKVERMTPELRPPRHHGNLREALIDAGIALLQKGGTAALTLRRAAARAGVSHAAPAHHFDGLSGLLTAIATRAFSEFSASMIAARVAAGSTPRGQLSGICAGYLAFATEHSALFHLMFVSPEVNRADPAFKATSSAAYEVLRDACQPFAADGQQKATLEIAVWSLVHGYALLGFAPTRQQERPFSQIPDFDTLLTRLLRPQV